MECHPLTVKELRELAACSVRENHLPCTPGVELRALRDAAATARFDYHGVRYRGPVYIVWWTLKELLGRGVEVYVRGEDGALRAARTGDAEATPTGITQLL